MQSVTAPSFPLETDTTFTGSWFPSKLQFLSMTKQFWELELLWLTWSGNKEVFAYGL